MAEFSEAKMFEAGYRMPRVGEYVFAKISVLTPGPLPVAGEERCGIKDSFHSCMDKQSPGTMWRKDWIKVGRQRKVAHPGFVAVLSCFIP